MNPLSGSHASDAPPAAEGRALEKTGGGLDVENLKTGSRWQGRYQIGELSPDVTYGRVYKALNLTTREEVSVRVFKVRDGVRAKTWGALAGAQNGELLDFVEAVEQEGRRAEVTRLVSAPTLREWAGGRTMTSEERLQLIGRLSETVDCLHRHGVTHLNLRPDTIFVVEEGALRRFVVGGFEKAQLFEGEEGPAEVSVDPFYAPPEAAGNFQFAREPGLRAWDWWSLGRVFQEIVLGRPVLSLVLERDVVEVTPELRSRAEALIKEENHLVRAGAVELMSGIDRELNLLLRGLLTSARDARWGFGEIQAWLRKAPVKERYNLPKNERLFRWREQAFTIAEAGEYFSMPQHWSEALENLYEPTQVTSLAYFIAKEPAHKKHKERLDVLLQLPEAPLLKELPPDIVRDVVASVALKSLAGHLAPLIFRGRRVDEACLREWLVPESQPQGLILARAFTAHPVVQQIEQDDAETGRMLDELDRIDEAAEALAKRNFWVSMRDPVQRATLMLLCMEPEPSLNAVRSEMRGRYACSRDARLDVLFKKEVAAPAELAILAFTAKEPVKFGYVTHRQWNEEEYVRLGRRALQLMRGGTWIALARSLSAGPLLFGHFGLLLLFWLAAAAAIALVWQNIAAYVVAIACPTAVLLLRSSWYGLVRQRLGPHVSKERPWRLSSGVAECRKEAELALGGSRLPKLAELLEMLRAANEEIARLTLEPKPKPLPLPHRFKDTWTLSLGSWFVAAAVCGATAWQAVRHPPKMPTIDVTAVARWLTPAAGESAEKPARPFEQAAAESVRAMQGELEALRRERKKAGAQDVKMTWPFKAPPEAQPIRIVDTLPAVSRQEMLGQEMATLILERYEPSTIDDLVAVQVPVEKGVGLMLFNGRTGKMAGKKVYVVGFVPMPKSWLQLEATKAIFLNGK